MKKRSVWVIEWVDSRTSSTGWVLKDEIDKPGAVAIFTVGFIVKESKEAISIAQSRGDRGGQYCGIMDIPKVCIVKRRKIAKVTRR